SSRRRHTRLQGDLSSDVCSSDLERRVVTDYATFAYLADVYIEDAHQGHGLGKWLVESVQSHPRLQGLRRWTLATKDAHGLYAQRSEERRVGKECRSRGSP